MASGGARGGAGRPADPNALRRGRSGDTVEFVLLPRVSDVVAPEWPLDGQGERESFWWARLWRKPQAGQWLALDLVDEVALYCRYLVEAEQPGAQAAVRTLVKQHQEMLGLSTAGMARLKWRVVADEVAPKREEREQPKRRSSRDRLKVVNGDGG